MFIVVEGLDGSGKTLQMKNIEQMLIESKRKYIITREPGGTQNPVGEQLRTIILNNKMDDYTRGLLYAASRYEHQLKIKQWIKEGYIVVSDRYIYSSLAYQSENYEDITELLYLNRYKNMIKPDIILHLDITLDTYKKRKDQRSSERELDELEKKSDKFFKKSIEQYENAYSYLHHLNSSYTVLHKDNVWNKQPNVCIIDGNKSITKVTKAINKIIKEKVLNKK